MRTIPSLLLAVVSAATAAAQTTLTVNSAGGAQFTNVGSAIAASAPGDRIVVEGSRPYPAFLVDRGVDLEAIASAVCASIEVVGNGPDPHADAGGTPAPRALRLLRLRGESLRREGELDAAAEQLGAVLATATERGELAEVQAAMLALAETSLLRNDPAAAQ
jgi:hypothetical protein